VDPAAALADLTEISSQIETAVLLDGDGGALASVPEGGEAAERLAAVAPALLAAAREAPTSAGRELTQLEASLGQGSVFVVRGEGRTIAATTVREPTAGLVLYDLRACLRSLATAPEPPKRSRRSRRAAGESEAAGA
jgi:predicted regulator of Ras-like GTPase activity (Roadblock/LC7/MglB family)